MKTTTYLATKDGVTKSVSDQPEPTKADILRSYLTIHCTAYDHAIRLRAARNPRVYHNPFALGLYLEAVERIVQSMDCEGVTLTQALHENFTGHMLNYMLRHAVKAAR